MNGPIEAIARELGFDGDPFLEGLVVSIFIVGAFIGSMSSASLISRLGCRRTLQIDMIPLIVGTLLRYPFANFLLQILRIFQFQFQFQLLWCAVWTLYRIQTTDRIRYTRLPA